MLTAAAAYVFLILALVVAGFQIALVAGMPWGKLTWGGKHPGRLPPSMRGVAFASALLMGVFAVVVVSRAGLAFSSLQPASSFGIWIVVAYCVLGVIANSITRSPWERVLWLPSTLLMLAGSLIVAVS